MGGGVAGVWTRLTGQAGVLQPNAPAHLHLHHHQRSQGILMFAQEMSSLALKGNISSLSSLSAFICQCLGCDRPHLPRLLCNLPLNQFPPPEEDKGGQDEPA